MCGERPGDRKLGKVNEMMLMTNFLTVKTAIYRHSIVFTFLLSILVVYIK
jgi:hypothetical protein